MVLFVVAFAASSYSEILSCRFVFCGLAVLLSALTVQRARSIQTLVYIMLAVALLVNKQLKLEV